MKMASTVPAMFLDVCEKFAKATDKVAYGRKVDGQWKTITHSELRSDVESFALGIQLHGIVPGERIGIIAENRIEWAIADFAITSMSAIDVPIFPTLTARQVAYIYNDCDAACVIVSNKYQLKKVKEVWDDIPSLRLVIVMNDDVEPEERVLRFADVIKGGRDSASDTERRTKFETMARRVHEDDLLTLIYTSGTTGHPKGVMLTHKNLMSNIAGSLAIVHIDESDVFLSYLPMCHSYERMTGFYLAFAVGASTYIAESIETVADNMREIRPTVMTSVPRLFERIKMRVEGAVRQEGGLKEKIFNWAIAVGREASAGGPVVSKSLRYKLADALVFKKIRDRTGGRLRFFVSGGAALSYDVGHFFYAIGLRILEGYGLTETSPVLCFNREGEEELGTVGKPIPNVEIKIADDGEILARGPNIMKGYWKNEDATRDAIEPDGWFHTGDIGRINERGRLQITDRKKHILVSSGGKNIAPQLVEGIITASPLVDQAILIGDHREFCTALIVPSVDGAQQWAKDQNIVFGSWEELVSSKELFTAIQKDLNQLQHHLSKYERVRRFRLLPIAFTVENGMMTPTLKVKRKAVIESYAAVIDELYAGKGTATA